MAWTRRSNASLSRPKGHPCELRLALASACLVAAVLPSAAEAKGAGTGHHSAQCQHHERDGRGEHHSRRHPARGHDFVKRAGSKLRLHGEEFRFAGTNNYYLMYKSKAMVDDVLEAAAEQGFSVMRTWSSIVIGAPDGSDSISGIPDGVYFQYLGDNGPTFNDGPDGLERLDYVVAKAREVGVRLVIPLVNNWADFGGMDQYVRWNGGGYHDDFYTDRTIRRWYKAWIAHLLNRTNIYTGERYKDDPTIMTWELANEPRCLGSGDYERSADCTSETLVEWADAMSRFIHRIDDKHLVSVGDEGFYCDPNAENWIDQCGEGVDTLALTALPRIDVMSFHLYPDGWGQTRAWSKAWIERHFADAAALHKPAMLGEFGWGDSATRNPVYKEWTDSVLESGGSGALYWLLSGQQDDGSLYPDYDGFTVYCPGPVCTTLTNFGTMMGADQALEFAPVADDDATETELDAPVLIDVMRNDVSYAVSLDPASIDLDPAGPGTQALLALSEGTFSAQTDGSVMFAPSAGFAGTVQASYTILDASSRVSNAAIVLVTVNPAEDAPLVLHSFENGTEGFSGAGTVEQSRDFATDGSFSLKISGSSGAWFGTTYGAPIDLSQKTILEWDVYSENGTSQQLAIQVGSGWDWCEGGGWMWVNGGNASTVTIDLATLTCSSGNAPVLSEIDTFNVFMGDGGGAVYVDRIRAKANPASAPGSLLHSFEADTEGFTGNGIVEQSGEFASEGSHSLKVSETGGDWFGTVYTTPRDFSGSTQLTWDVYTDGGTSQQLAVQTGESWDWCEAGDWTWISGGLVSTMAVDLSALNCQSGNPPELADVRAVKLFMGNGGAPIYIDNVRLM